MRERPILFSGAMVHAILDGKKTQTRRIVREQSLVEADGADIVHLHSTKCPGYCEYACGPLRCPYGVPGDRLWVKETYYSEKQEQAGTGAVRWVVHLDGSPRIGAFYRATQPLAPTKRWKPAIHMPRCLSRIKLEVTGVRVERLQDITEADARAEGVEPWDNTDDTGRIGERSYRAAFAHLWDSLNAARAPWESNPWVWRIEFRRVDRAVP